MNKNNNAQINKNIMEKYQQELIPFNSLANKTYKSAYGSNKPEI